MKRNFFIVSDIEMGQRDIMDDFSDDGILAEFVSEISQNGPTTLILNGDIFDFLKMSYQGEHTRYITEAVSVWKLERIFEAHRLVFETLRDFLKNDQNRLFFVIGNHDLDLVWPRLQEIIRRHLGHVDGQNLQERIEFAFTFDNEFFHAEHGHDLDPFFQHDRRKLFVKYKGKTMLNLPVGSQLIFSHLANFKRKFPKEEQLYPHNKVKDYYPEYAREIKKMFWLYVWKVALDPALHLFDPTYRVRYKPFVKHILRYGIDFVDDERFLSDRIDEIMKRNPSRKLFVLSHTHVLREFVCGDQRVLATDTWRDEYSLLDVSRPKKPKSYAQIVVENNLIKEAQLKIFVPAKSRQHQSLEKESMDVEKIDLEARKSMLRE